MNHKLLSEQNRNLCGPADISLRVTQRFSFIISKFLYIYRKTYVISDCAGIPLSSPVSSGSLTYPIPIKTNRNMAVECTVSPKNELTRYPNAPASELNVAPSKDFFFLRALKKIPKQPMIYIIAMGSP